jgi:uncharacterized protein (DUF305 family)
MIEIIVFFLLFLIYFTPPIKEYFVNPVSKEFPCRAKLSDTTFLIQMIFHHEVAVNISVEHIKHTKSDILTKIIRELIWTQNYEIELMKQELQSKTENVSIINVNQDFIPTTFSFIYPNSLGLTNVNCDPMFFNPSLHTTSHKTSNLDSEYIKHMIPHHQVAVDMCKMILKNTKSDFIIYLAYRVIRNQESEVVLLNDLLKSYLIS